MESRPFIILLAGLGGGLLRGIVGITKSKALEKGKFNLTYLAVTLGVAALVGIVAAILADKNPEIAFLAGYAGTDFIEGLCKIRLKQDF